MSWSKDHPVMLDSKDSLFLGEVTVSLPALPPGLQATAQWWIVTRKVAYTHDKVGTPWKVRERCMRHLWREATVQGEPTNSPEHQKLVSIHSGGTEKNNLGNIKYQLILYFTTLTSTLLTIINIQRYKVSCL